MTERPGQNESIPRSSILDPRSSISPIAGSYASRVRPPVLEESLLPGRWRRGAGKRSGATIGQTQNAGVAGIAWAATMRAAALHQSERGRSDGAGPIILHAADLRFRRRRQPAGCLLLFLVDTSGSMAAWRRMRQTKAAILALLVQAYQHRDRVALLAFRGNAADLVLPPTHGLAKPKQALEDLPTGGLTPLALGLAAARRFIVRQQRGQRQQPIWTVLLTDGRANVPMTSGDPWEDAVVQARWLAECDSEFLLVDTETGWPRFGRAGQLAHALGTACLPLERVLGRSLDRRAARFSPGGLNPAARPVTCGWEAAS
jgi:magnesium chelatase subunit D